MFRSAKTSMHFAAAVLECVGHRSNKPASIPAVPAKVQQDGRRVLEVNLGYSLFNSWVGKLTQQKVYEFDNFRLDASHRILSRDGRDIELAPKAVETLLALVERRGEVISKDDLLEAVWPDTIVEESNLFSYLSHLRKALGNRKDGKPYVETLRRRGYRFTGDVRLVHTETDSDSYAWVVDNPDEDAVNVETRSGRLYVLKDWDRIKPVSVRAQASPQPQVTELPNAPADERNKPLAVEQNDEAFPKRLRRAYLIAALLLGAVIVSSLGFYLWRANSQPAPGPIKSIAVLPFKPLSDENGDRSLGRGMADALIAKLGGARGIRVLPFSAVNRFDSLDQDAAKVGQQLGVDAVLDSTIQTSGGRVGVRVRLISVRTGEHLWTEPFDDELSDFIAVQESIAERVANRLRVELSENARKRYTDNPLAYRLYLAGRSDQLKLTPPDTKRAIGNYQKAIDHDPNYALAYTGISDCYRGLILSGEFPPGETIDRAMAAAELAVKIDPTLAEAQASLGHNYFWFKRDWIASEAAFQRALAIDPNSAFAHHHYAHLLSNMGRHDDALVHAEEVRKLEPYSAYSFAVQGMVYQQAGKLDEAFVRFDEAKKFAPDLWLTYLYEATAYTDLRRFEDAIAAAQKASEHNPSQSISVAYESVARAGQGRRDEAKKLLDGLLKRSAETYVPPYHIAIAYMGLGDSENALLWLEKSFSEQDPKIVFLKVHHVWDGLRQEPRFIELIRKMKLE